MHNTLVHDFQGSEAVSEVWVSSLPTADPRVVAAPTPSFQHQGWWGEAPLSWDSELSPVAITCFPWFVTGKRRFWLHVADCLQQRWGWDDGSRKRRQHCPFLKCNSVSAMIVPDRQTEHTGV